MNIKLEKCEKAIVSVSMWDLAKDKNRIVESQLDQDCKERKSL